jgi:hypothetical protein
MRWSAMDKKKETRIRCTMAVFEKYYRPDPQRSWTYEEMEQFFKEHSIDIIPSMKADRSFSWFINIKKYLIIEQRGDQQFIKDKRENNDLESTQLCVHLRQNGMLDCYEIPLVELQDILIMRLSERFSRNDHVRPIDPQANTFGLRPAFIAQYKME